MSDRHRTYCINHPSRLAVEQCEVCGKPLCAYCLYYTEDGQRLCAQHAEYARLAGMAIEEPDVYADQIIGAQAGLLSKQKRDDAADDSLYKGNSNDLMALLGLLISVISMGACCGAAYCMPLGGLVLSLVALINAGKAYDSRRTRRMAVVGLLFSGVWVAVIAACIAFYGWSLTTLQQSMTTFSGSSLFGATSTYTSTPAPTATPTEEGDTSPARFDYGFPHEIVTPTPGP
ncbi:MAG: hypothetical protein JXJ20_12555 [Anaerolineae bacterium]|nr:hypothetical protein [Anaerolineae bacterium]